MCTVTMATSSHSARSSVTKVVTMQDEIVTELGSSFQISYFGSTSPRAPAGITTDIMSDNNQSVADSHAQRFSLHLRRPLPHPKRIISPGARTSDVWRKYISEIENCYVECWSFLEKRSIKLVDATIRVEEYSDSETYEELAIVLELRIQAETLSSDLMQLEEDLWQAVSIPDDIELDEVSIDFLISISLGD